MEKRGARLVGVPSFQLLLNWLPPAQANPFSFLPTPWKASGLERLLQTLALVPSLERGESSRGVRGGRMLAAAPESELVFSNLPGWWVPHPSAQTARKPQDLSRNILEGWTRNSNRRTEKPF